MSSSIIHSGRICEIGTDRVYVLVSQVSACATCSAAHLCQSSESREHRIEVLTSDADQYEVGQEVIVEGMTSAGLKAVVLAYITPMVLLMVTVMTCIAAGLEEPLAALAGIAVILAYLAVLWIMRDVTCKTFRFKIRKSKI